MSSPLDLLTKAVVVMKKTTIYMKDGTVEKKIATDVIKDCEKAVLEGILDLERMHFEFKEGQYEE